MKNSRTVLLLLLLFTAISIGGVYFFQQNIGDIRPALLPAKEFTSSDTQMNTTQHNQKDMNSLKLSNLPYKLPDGYGFTIFAEDLGAARDLEIDANGTVLVSIPANGEVIALSDKNGDGEAENSTVILSNLNKPHGLAFHEGKLFVAEESQVVRYLWDTKALKAQQDKVLFSLPGGGRHSSRTIAFDEKGNMYVSIGSTCDVCYEKDERNGSVMISDKDGNNPRIFASGLRNAPFITRNPITDEIWVTEMGRDFLGDTNPPDEINILQDKKDYGWPICYGDKIHDKTFSKVKIDDPQKICANTVSPVYNIPAHSAPLGLAFIGESLEHEWRGDLLVAYHGSWNSTKPVGYKIVRLNVEGNTVIGQEDFMSGFLQGAQAIGRPVDVIFDQQGNLYVSDDKAGRIYMVIKTK